MISRRAFCAAAAGLAAGSTASARAATTSVAHAAPQPATIRGVNLGAWLVLEKWISPSLFEGVEAGDEYTFCKVLGPAEAARRLQRHRSQWITNEDFKWLADVGINTVRIPVGYWIAESNPPFVTGFETLDAAFAMAKRNGIGVIVDLHGAPGSQNGFDHSGRAGALEWATNRANVDHTLSVVEDLAQRCRHYDNIVGFELLNEPRWDVPIDVLKAYYLEGYRRVRKSLSAEQTAVIFHDAFRPDEWKTFMQTSDYRNAILDTHIYQCFTDDDHKRAMPDQLQLAATGHTKQLAESGGALPVMVGEWSCALPPESLNGLSDLAKSMSVRGYGAAQLVTFEATRGWVFWTYKTESGGGWSFRDCVKTGAMPGQFR